MSSESLADLVEFIASELRPELVGKGVVETLNEAAAALRSTEQERDELKAFQQAIFEAGLIQFGDNPETRCYSVWGFSRWHHDPDLLTAIRAVNEDLTP